MFCHSEKIINSLSDEYNMSKEDIDSIWSEYDDIYGAKSKFDNNKFKQLVDSKKKVKTFISNEIKFKELNDFFNKKTNNGLIIDKENNISVTKLENIFGKDNVYHWNNNTGETIIRINKPVRPTEIKSKDDKDYSSINKDNFIKINGRNVNFEKIETGRDKGKYKLYYNGDLQDVGEFKNPISINKNFNKLSFNERYALLQIELKTNPNVVTAAYNGVNYLVDFTKGNEKIFRGDYTSFISDKKYSYIQTNVTTNKTMLAKLDSNTRNEIFNIANKKRQALIKSESGKQKAEKILNQNLSEEERLDEILKRTINIQSNKIELDPDSFDAKLNSWINITSLSTKEKYELSTKVVQTATYTLNLFVGRPKEAIEQFRKEGVEISDSTEKKILSNPTRENIIQSLGLNKIFDYIKNHYYINYLNTKDFDLVDEETELTEQQVTDIIDNFDAVIFCGRTTLTNLEKQTINISGKFELTDQDIENIYDDNSDFFEKIEELDRESWQMDNDSISALKSISKEILTKLYTIPIREDDIIVDSKYVVPEFIDGKVIAGKILDICYNQSSFERMINKLSQYRDLYNWVDTVINDVANVEPAKFFVSFRKTRKKRLTITNEVEPIVTFGEPNHILEIREMDYDYSDVNKIYQKTKNKIEVGVTAKNNPIFIKDKNNKIFINLDNLNELKRNLKNDENINLILNNLGLKNILTSSEIKFLLNENRSFKKSIETLLIAIDDYATNNVDDNGEQKPFKFNFKIEKAFKGVVRKMQPVLSEKKEKMQYESGKSYYAYNNPSFVDDIVDFLSNKDELMPEEFIQKVKDYYNDGFLIQGNKFKNQILQKVIDNEQFRSSIEYVNNINIEDMSYNKNDVRNTNAYLEAITSITLFFNKPRFSSYKKIHENAQSHEKAYYSIGILSNKTQRGYMLFDCINTEKSDWRDQFSLAYFNLFTQELDRIKDVLRRAENGASILIQKRDIPRNLAEKINYDNPDFSLLRNTGASFKYMKNWQFILEGNDNRVKTNILYYNLRNLMMDYIKEDNPSTSTISDLRQAFRQSFYDTTEEIIENGRKKKVVKSKGIFQEYLDKNYNKLKSLKLVGITEEYEEAKRDKEGNVIKEKNKKTGKVKTVKITKKRTLSPISEFNRLSSLDEQRELVENFLLNNYLNQAYINQLLQIDLAYDKNAEDTEKRAAAYIAPGTKLNVDATFVLDPNSATIKEKRASADGIQRSVFIKDEEVISELIPIIENIFNKEIEKHKNTADEAKLKIYKGMMVAQLNTYKGMKVADGQSHNSPTSLFKKTVMQGKNTNDTLEAIKRIASGNLNISDLDIVLAESQKPVNVGFQTISVNEGEGLFNSIKIPMYIKDSETCILLADALVRGSGENSILTAIYNVMEMSAYDDATIEDVTDNKGRTTHRAVTDFNKYNGKGIDNFTMVSCLKRGETNSIDLSKESIDRFIENSGRNFNTRTEAIEAYLLYALYDSNGNYTSNVIETKFEDCRIQQEIPSKFRGHEQQIGVQEMAIMPMDLDPNKIFNGKTGLQIQKECLQLAADYVEESVKEVEELFGLNDEHRKNTIEKLIENYNKDKKDNPNEADKNLLKSINRQVNSGKMSDKFAFGIDYSLFDSNGNQSEYSKFIEDGYMENNNSSRAYYKLSKIQDENNEDGLFGLIKSGNIDAIDYTIQEYERKQMLSNILKKQILKNDKYDNELLQAVSINEKTGDFFIPLNDHMHSTRIQQLLNSILKDRINKIKASGAPIVQASSYGLDEKLHVRYKDKVTGRLLEVGETSDNAVIAYHEIYISIPWKDLYNDLIKEDGSIMTPQEAIDEGIITEEMLYSIGYRIPTENKSSIYPMKIVGFLPTAGGEKIILPEEIVAVTGSDFDIDKTFIMFKYFNVKKGYLKTNSTYFNNINEMYGNELKSIHYHKDIIRLLKDKNTPDDLKQSLKEILNNWNAFYVPSKITLKDKSKDGIVNKLLGIHWNIMSSESMQFLMHNPQGFNNLKRSTFIDAILENQPKVAYLQSLNVDDILKLSLDEAKNLYDRYGLGAENLNILDFSVQLDMFQKNMDGLKLIGIFANNNVSHSYVQMFNNICKEESGNPDDGVRVIYNEDFYFDGIYFSGYGDGVTYKSTTPLLDNIYDSDNLNYISVLNGSFIGASADIVKEDYLTTIGIIPETANVAALLSRQGLSEMHIALLFKQPIIQKVIQEYLIEKSNYYVRFEDFIDDYLYKKGKNKMDAVNEILRSPKNAQTESFSNPKTLSLRTLAYFIKNYKENEKGEAVDADGKRDYNKEIQQLAVLKMFNILLSASKNLNMLTKQTKYPSINSSVGPMIVNNIIKYYNYQDFINSFDSADTQGFSENTKDIVKKLPFLKALFDNLFEKNSVTERLFKPYFTEYEDNTFEAIDMFILSNNMHIDETTLKKVVSCFKLFQLTSGRNPFFNQDILHRKDIIVDFPQRFKEFMANNENYLLDNCFVEENKLGFEEIITSLNNLQAEESDLIKADWTKMFMENPEIGIYIMNYFLQRNGFDYIPKGGIHLVPMAVKLASGYANAINNQKDKVDALNFLNQFYMNNSWNSKIVPVIKLNKENEKYGIKYKFDNEEEIITLDRTKTWGSFKGRKGNLIKAFKHKNNLYLLYDYDEKYPNTAVYKKVTTLGEKFSFIEFDANTDAFDMVSVIDAIKKQKQAEKKEAEALEQNANVKLVNHSQENPEEQLNYSTDDLAFMMGFTDAGTTSQGNDEIPSNNDSSDLTDNEKFIKGLLNDEIIKKWKEDNSTSNRLYYINTMLAHIFNDFTVNPNIRITEEEASKLKSKKLNTEFEEFISDYDNDRIDLIQLANGVYEIMDKFCK